jgi:hypothetical protein
VTEAIAATENSTRNERLVPPVEEAEAARRILGRRRAVQDVGQHVVERLCIPRSWEEVVDHDPLE